MRGRKTIPVYDYDGQLVFELTEDELEAMKANLSLIPLHEQDSFVDEESYMLPEEDWNSAGWSLAYHIEQMIEDAQEKLTWSDLQPYYERAWQALMEEDDGNYWETAPPEEVHQAEALAYYLLWKKGLVEPEEENFKKNQETQRENSAQKAKKRERKRYFGASFSP